MLTQHADAGYEAQTRAASKHFVSNSSQCGRQIDDH